ncbi:MAG: HPr kinase/phosphatase C-terminal domain-containing protein [Sphingomonadales bacterium]
MPSLSSETMHATCVLIHGSGVLIEGASGSGKSDLALRLIDRGAKLVSDDYTFLQRQDGHLVASPPATIAGKIEVRELGIVDMAHVTSASVALLVSLGEPPARLPEPGQARLLLGVEVPLVLLEGRDSSAPIKVELALARMEKAV